MFQITAGNSRPLALLGGRCDKALMGTIVNLGGDGQVAETIGQALYGRIRADILFGRLVPGERLRLEAFSQRYGSSVSTVRELLSRLVSEGLIVAEGQKGFEVAPASPEEFREIAELRLLIEGHALSQAFAGGDLDWEASVVAAHHKLSVTEAKMLQPGGGDAELWKRCDRDFHHALIAACGSRALMATHAAVYDKYLRYQMIAVVFRGEVAAREHGELLDCALNRDAKRANAILRIHIDSCVEHALADPDPSWAKGRRCRSVEREGAGRAQRRT